MHRLRYEKFPYRSVSLAHFAFQPSSFNHQDICYPQKIGRADAEIGHLDEGGGGSVDRCVPSACSRAKYERASRPQATTEQRKTPAHANKVAHANQLPGYLLTKRAAAFGSPLCAPAPTFRAEFLESWQGQFQGQSWGQRVPCNSKRVVYVGFSPR